MELQFTVDNQNISFQKPSESVVNDSTNYVKAIFSFSGKLWEKNGTKTAIFRQMNKAYSVILTDDWCYVPPEVLKNCGFSVGVMTTYQEGEKPATVWTKDCIVDTSPSCYADNFANGVTPSQYEQIMALIASSGTGGGSTSVTYDAETETLKISNITYDEQTETLTIGG